MCVVSVVSLGSLLAADGTFAAPGGVWGLVRMQEEQGLPTIPDPEAVEPAPPSPIARPEVDPGEDVRFLPDTDEIDRELSPNTPGEEDADAIPSPRPGAWIAPDLPPLPQEVEQEDRAEGATGRAARQRVVEEEAAARAQAAGEEAELTAEELETRLQEPPEEAGGLGGEPVEQTPAAAGAEEVPAGAAGAAGTEGAVGAQGVAGAEGAAGAAGTEGVARPETETERLRRERAELLEETARQREQIDGLLESVETLGDDQLALQQQTDEIEEEMALRAERGAFLERNRLERVAGLSETQVQVNELGDILATGTGDVDAALASMGQYLETLAQDAAAYGGEEEAVMSREGRLYVERAREALVRDDLFGARMNLALALIPLQQAVEAAETSAQPLYRE